MLERPRTNWFRGRFRLERSEAAVPTAEAINYVGLVPRPLMEETETDEHQNLPPFSFGEISTECGVPVECPRMRTLPERKASAAQEQYRKLWQTLAKE